MPIAFVLNFLESIGHSLYGLFASIGRIFIFALKAVSHILIPPFFARITLKQFMDIGFYSLPVVGMTALFTGMVLALQSYTGFTRFNAENAIDLNPDEVVALDKKWRADDQELISATTENALSNFLKAKLEESDGQFTEIFVMDDKGLNVGQSGLTSDYWQGDEAKWQETFAKGANAIHVSDVEFDESSQTYQVQISTTISDGETPIGAITLGIDAETIE